MSLKRLKSTRLRARFSSASTRSRVRLRRNGVNDAPQGMAGGQWRSRWQSANRTASKFLMDLLTDMKRIDPRSAETPSEASLTGLSSDFADVMAASDLAKVSFSEGKVPSQELLDRARVDEDAASIIESIAGVPLMRMFTGSPDARKVADNTIKRLVRTLSEMREPLMEYVEQQGAGFADIGEDEEDELEAEVESALGGGGGIDIRGDIASGRFSVEEEDEDEPRPTRRRKKDEPEEEFVPSEGTITVRKKRQAGAGRGEPQLSRQVGGFEQQIVKKRRNDLRPSAALLAAVAKDVLIFELDDGTAQVWPKGTITHTFGPTRGRSAAKTAVIYARGWREADGAPKSRLKCRIVYSRFDDGDNFVVVEEGQTAAAPVADTRSIQERAAAIKNPYRTNPEHSMKWERYHDDRAKGAVLDPEGEIYSLTKPGVGTVEMFKQERTAYMPAHWQVDLYLDDPEADDRLALKGRSKFASTMAEAKRRANEMLTTRSNPDWAAFFGRAKKKGAEGAAAAQLAARKAAHQTKILAMKGRIAAERQRVRSAYAVVGPSLRDARDGRAPLEETVIYEVADGLVPFNHPHGYQHQKRTRTGFFRLVDELAELERTRPNPKKKGKKAKGLPHPSLSTVLERGPRSAHVRLGTGHTGTRMPAHPVRRNFLGSFFGPDKFVVVTYNRAGRVIDSVRVKTFAALSDALADLKISIKGEKRLLSDVEKKGRADRSDEDLFSVWGQMAGMERLVIEPVGV